MQFDFILPVVYNDQDIAFNNSLASTLEKRGASVALLAHTKYGQRELEKSHANVFYLYEGFDHRHESTPDEIRAVEQRYDLGSLADFVYPEQIVPGAQRQELLFRRAIHNFRFLEEFFGRHNVSAFLNNLGPELIRRCAFRLRDQGGPENLVMDFAPIRGRFAITTQEVAWDELPTTLPALTPEQRASTIRYVTQQTAEAKAFYPNGALSVNARNVTNFLRYASRFMRERSDVNLPELVYQRAESVVRVRGARLLYRRPPAGENYVFFPLHLCDDSAITIRAPQFQRQQEILRYIAERVLPVGWKLYTKPHPAAMHAFSLSMLSEISRIPNVRLLDARIVAHEVIRSAQAIIAINSTVGFEALLYGKPVVSLGRVFYRGWGVTTDIDQLADLRHGLRRAVANPPNMEDIYRFVHACEQATYPGHLSQQTPENLDRVADAMLAKLSKLGLTRSEAGRGASVATAG